jgi:cytochrome c
MGVRPLKLVPKGARMFRSLSFALALAALAGPAAAADGARVFQLQCRTCHADASTPMAPTLKGVFGARIAGRADYKYSAALAGKKGVWDAAALDAFLTAPAKFAPGVRMPTGVARAEDRAAVIEHLKTLK